VALGLVLLLVLFVVVQHWFQVVVTLEPLVVLMRNVVQLLILFVAVIMQPMLDVVTLEQVVVIRRVAIQLKHAVPTRITAWEVVVMMHFQFVVLPFFVTETV